MCIATGSQYCVKDLSVYPYLLETVVEEKQCLIKSKECAEHHIGLEGIMQCDKGKYFEPNAETCKNLTIDNHTCQNRNPECKDDNLAKFPGSIP